MFFTNPYFSHTLTKDFVREMEDLIDEIVSITGIKIIYIPRVWEDRDNILNEITHSSFPVAYALRGHIENSDSLETENFVLTKLGLAYEDSMMIDITVPKHIFKAVVGKDSEITGFAEGDLVYIPKLKLMTEIVSAGTKNRPFVDDANTLLLDIVVKPWKDAQYVFGDYFDVFDNMEGKNELFSLLQRSKNLGRDVPSMDNDCITLDDEFFTLDNDMKGFPKTYPTLDADGIRIDADKYTMDMHEPLIDRSETLRQRTEISTAFSKNDTIEKEAQEFVQVLNTIGFDG